MFSAALPAAREYGRNNVATGDARFPMLRHRPSRSRLSMSGNQALDTGTSTGRFILSAIAAVGQAEREGMLERQRDGIAKAKHEGRYKGRVLTVRLQSAMSACPSPSAAPPIR